MHSRPLIRADSPGLCPCLPRTLICGHRPSTSRSSSGLPEAPRGPEQRAWDSGGSAAPSPTEHCLQDQGWCSPAAHSSACLFSFWGHEAESTRTQRGEMEATRTEHIWEPSSLPFRGRNGQLGVPRGHLQGTAAWRTSAVGLAVPFRGPSAGITGSALAGPEHDCRLLGGDTCSL